MATVAFVVVLSVVAVLWGAFVAWLEHRHHRAQERAARRALASYQRSRR